MKKTLSAFFVFLALLFIAASVSADTLVLPESLKEIADEAFMGDASIEEVVLPEGLEKIGERAFAGSGVSRVYLPESIQYIAPMAFEGCAAVTGYGKGNDYVFDYFTQADNLTIEGEKWIPSPVEDFKFKILSDTTCKVLKYIGTDTEIVIPRKDAESRIVIGIEEDAFRFNRSMTSIIIPDSVTNIGDYAFCGCTSLTSVTIPGSVTSIGYCAFSQCNSLTSVTISDGVTSIGRANFEQCRNLTNVTIPNSVTNIGIRAFYGCESLTSITIPDSVTSIGGDSFACCYSLRSIVIPDSVTSIGNEAFLLCKSLISIMISDSVTSIGNDTFRGCTSLTSIMIPDSVTVIGYHAFDGCTSLTSIVIPDSVSRIGNCIFTGCTGLTNVTIPDSIKSIGYMDFFGCTGLTSVTIPDSVTSIDREAFSYCTGLTSITIPNSVISIGDSAFKNCANLTIYGDASSFAEEFANRLNIPFAAVDLAQIVHVKGVFDKSSINMKAGQTVQMSGKVTSVNAPFTRVTLTIAGYNKENDPNDRYTTVDFSGKNLNAIQLADYPALSLDSSCAPFNVPGIYTVNLWAQADGMEKGVLLDSIAVTVEPGDIQGSFAQNSITLALGESRQLSGVVTSKEDNIWRVTLTIDGYDPLSDGSNRYSYDDFTYHYTKQVYLENWAAFTLDTSKEPLNAVGMYVVRLWASTLGAEEETLLDIMTVSVEQASPDPQAAKNPFKEYKIGGEAKVTVKNRNEAGYAYAKTNATVEAVTVKHNNKSYTLIKDPTASTETEYVFTASDLDIPAEGLNTYEFIAAITGQEEPYTATTTHYMYTPCENPNAVTLYVQEDETPTYNVYGAVNGKAAKDTIVVAVGMMNGMYYIPDLRNGSFIIQEQLAPVTDEPIAAITEQDYKNWYRDHIVYPLNTYYNFYVVGAETDPVLGKAITVSDYVRFGSIWNGKAWRFSNDTAFAWQSLNDNEKRRIDLIVVGNMLQEDQEKAETILHDNMENMDPLAATANRIGVAESEMKVIFDTTQFMFDTAKETINVLNLKSYINGADADAIESIKSIKDFLDDTVDMIWSIYKRSIEEVFADYSTTVLTQEYKEEYAQLMKTVCKEYVDYLEINLFGGIGKSQEMSMEYMTSFQQSAYIFISNYRKYAANDPAMQADALKALYAYGEFDEEMLQAMEEGFISYLKEKLKDQQFWLDLFDIAFEKLSDQILDILKDKLPAFKNVDNTLLHKNISKYLKKLVYFDKDGFAFDVKGCLDQIENDLPSMGIAYSSEAILGAICSNRSFGIYASYRFSEQGRIPSTVSGSYEKVKASMLNCIYSIASTAWKIGMDMVHIMEDAAELTQQLNGKSAFEVYGNYLRTSVIGRSAIIQNAHFEELTEEKLTQLSVADLEEKRADMITLINSDENMMIYFLNMRKLNESAQWRFILRIANPENGNQVTYNQFERKGWPTESTIKEYIRFMGGYKNNLTDLPNDIACYVSSL